MADFPCARCGASIPIPDPRLRDAPTLVCPSCGQRYVRRASGTGATRAPTSPTSATPPPRTPPTPAPAATPRPTPPGVHGRTLPLSMPAAAAAAATFAAGDFVANRYRVLRFVARGGMGEVYEVEDLELRGRVALKTVASASAGEPGAVDRFKREIQLARRVTHPNVCRIFDVGFHEPATGAPPVVFLTMEMLEGETLVARLRRVGKLSTAAALPIARQLGGALAAAHEAGVVHRDFKSENVFLVPARSEGADSPGVGAERAVVTDFGIARAGGDDSFGITLTSDGGVIGTPAYMAPEQIEGRTITAAVDQYALGVVLFEMVTGELPFRGDNPLSTAARRLTEAPPSPRRFAPELDPRWERVILRCLERAPESRFPDVGAAVRALEQPLGPAVATVTSAPPPSVAAEASSSPAPPSAPFAPSTPSAPAESAVAVRGAGERRKRALAALLLVALGGAAGWSIWRVRRLRERVDLTTPTAARRGVAVLGLRNLSGRAEAAWLSTAFAEMLGTELARSRELRVVPGESVAHALVELGVEASEVPSGEARARLLRRLGADYFVLGTYTALAEGGALRLDLRLEDARSTEVRANVGETGTEAQLFELVAKAGESLRGALDAGADAAVAPRSSPEAARLYSQGLDALRGFDAQGASELLERAVAAEPGHALARSALASAWSALGYRARAEQEARRARELAGALPAEDRMLVEARYFEAAGEWARAAELWQKLWTAYPDTLAYGLRVATTRVQAGEPDLALATALALRSLPAPEGEDPRIDLAEAAAAAALGDARRQAEAAGRAADRATAQGARRLAAEALVARAWALRNLGQTGEARAAGERARSLYDQVGDRAGAAEADAALGGVLLDAGDSEGARRTYERALAASRELGDRGGEARALNNLAVLSRSRGELEAARADYERIASSAAETGDRIGGAFAANNLAAILADLGEFASAEARAQEALGVWRTTGDRGGAAAALANLGAVRRRQGDLAGAERAWEESLALRRETGQRPGEAAALNGLAQTRLERGDLATAGRDFAAAAALAREVSARSALATARVGEADVAAARDAGDEAAAALAEALAIRREIGERAGVARTRLAQARLALAGDAAAVATAAASARELLDAAGGERSPEVEAGARAVLARALLAGARPAEAREAIAPAVALAPRLARSASLDARLVATRVELAAGGSSGPAREELARLRAEAAAAGFAGAELEAALVEVEAASGEGAAELARRARAAGFEAVARRAEAASRPAGER